MSEADIEAQVERVVNEERRIPAEVLQEIKRAEKALSDACDHYASSFGPSTK